PRTAGRSSTSRTEYMRRPVTDSSPEARPRAGLRGSGPAARSERKQKPAGGDAPPVRRHGLARVLSKRGLCSRTEAARWIVAGRVSVDGRVVRDPEHPVVDDGRARIEIPGLAPAPGPAPRRFPRLTKPLRIDTTPAVEQAHATQIRVLEGTSMSETAMVELRD